MENCTFCTEDFEQNGKENPQLECKYNFHGICFIQYINEQLNNNHLPIKCPFCKGDKKHEINYKIILNCLLLNNKDDLALKLENISLNYLVENYPNEITYCPTPGCKYICSYDKNEFNLICPLCGKSYYLQCKTEWHKNLTCQEYQLTQKNNNKDDENDRKFEEYVKGKNYKQCPNCKRWVEKTEGCDHITCCCGTHFCYNCGGIRDPKYPYNHKCPYNRNKNNMILTNLVMNQNMNINNIGNDPFNMNNIGNNPFNMNNNNNQFPNLMNNNDNIMSIQFRNMNLFNINMNQNTENMGTFMNMNLLNNNMKNNYDFNMFNNNRNNNNMINMMNINANNTNNIIENEINENK